MKPFQVMCVAPGIFDHITNMMIESPVTVGSPYTVVHQQMEPEGLFYSLSEFDRDLGFDARLFAILPEKSADEINEQEHEALIYQR